MNFKEKMMENMIGKMSAEEKRQMMDAMMGKFFNNMTKEEKQNMMHEMMNKFFGSLSPDEKTEMMSNMMPKMMAGMMGNKMEGEEKNSGPMGFNPMEMCQKMMANMGKSSELATYATPEVRALFEEWVEQIENEILDYIKANNNTDPEIIAKQFKLSKGSVNFFITKLSQKGKIKIKAEAK